MLKMATSQADVWPDPPDCRLWHGYPFARLVVVPFLPPPVPFLIADVPRRALPSAEPTVATRVPVRSFPPPSRLATNGARSRSGGAAVWGKLVESVTDFW